MSTFMKEDLAGLLRLAIDAYGARIAELLEQRKQLVTLLDRTSATLAVEVMAPKKRPELSTEARAKIRAAQIARWEKARTEKARTQAPPVEKKGAQAQDPVRDLQHPAKATSSSPRKAKPAKNHSIKVAVKVAAKEAVKAAPEPAIVEELSRPQSVPDDDNSPAGIVEQMAQAGARFRITRGGSLIVGNLGSLPPAVQRMFLEHPDPHLLTAAARRHLASEGQALKQ